MKLLVALVSESVTSPRQHQRTFNVYILCLFYVSKDEFHHEDLESDRKLRSLGTFSDSFANTVGSSSTVKLFFNETRLPQNLFINVQQPLVTLQGVNCRPADYQAHSMRSLNHALWVSSDCQTA